MMGIRRSFFILVVVGVAACVPMDKSADAPTNAGNETEANYYAKCAASFQIMHTMLESESPPEFSAEDKASALKIMGAGRDVSLLITEHHSSASSAKLKYIAAFDAYAQRDASKTEAQKVRELKEFSRGCTTKLQALAKKTNTNK